MNSYFGNLESLVRVLIGLPTSVSYFYIRHYNAQLAYLLLAAGLALLSAGMGNELKAPVLRERRSK